MKTKSVYVKKALRKRTVQITKTGSALPKNLRNFLVFHCMNLMDCLELTHFYVFLRQNPKSAESMSVTVDYSYLLATISWGRNIVAIWKSKDRSVIVRYLCHELCHIITGETGKRFSPIKPGTLAGHFDERVNEQVSRIAYRLYVRWLRENKKCKRPFLFKE